MSWTYDTLPTATPSSEIPFEFISDGTTKSLLITYASEGEFLNNGAFNVSTAYVPTPALLPGLIGLGVAALRKRNEEEADQA
ncbi:MAG: PTPA-CTERM sorting domain-containing protein [Leptolyngbyaceae cyanobacterium SM2_5_2]|nr:PTPA-CTERM sorting domain-containing protein [Leptolyngbyaceae cyanobacterium SM2_5_2]